MSAAYVGIQVCSVGLRRLVIIGVRCAVEDLFRVS